MIGIRHIAAVLLIAGAALPSFGQIGEQRSNIAIGINGGINYNRVSFEKHRIKQNSLPGMNAGVTARYISEKYFAMICGIQMEVNYSQRGWDERFETEEGIKDPSLAYTRMMNYLEIPVLAHLAFGKDTGGHFFIHLGPQIAFMLNDSERTEGLNAEQPADKPVHGMKIERKFDYGITGGVGVEIRTKKLGNFLLEGRYYFGLADFFNSTKKDYFSKSANSTLTAKISYLFDIKK